MLAHPPHGPTGNGVVGDDDPEAFVRAQFRRLLGREPGVYEREAFVDAFENDPAVGPATVIRALIESREYQSR